jgi:hypothetical protein
VMVAPFVGSWPIDGAVSFTFRLVFGDENPGANPPRNRADVATSPNEPLACLRHGCPFRALAGKEGVKHLPMSSCGFGSTKSGTSLYFGFGDDPGELQPRNASHFYLRQVIKWLQTT